MLFRYSGGKAKIAKELVAAIQEFYVHAAEPYEFREVFFGSGAITFELLKSPPTKNIWINDFDRGIAAIWNCVHHYRDEFVEMIEAYVPDADDFYQYKSELTNGIQHMDTMDLGFKKLVIHQISYSGLGVLAGSPIGGRDQNNADGTPKKYQVGCRWSVDMMKSEIAKIGALLDGSILRTGGCTSLDFERVIADTKKKAFIYLDPPYYDMGTRLYQFGFDEADHARLAAALQRTEHPWMLSYDDCPEVRALYDWAHILSIDLMYTITTRHGRSTTKPEVVIVPKEYASLLTKFQEVHLVEQSRKSANRVKKGRDGMVGGQTEFAFTE